MEFFKYVAAGNDFIVLDRRHNPQEDYGDLAKKLCNRNFGIGADGLLVCETSKVGDIKMVYYNSDGSQGEICGNGIRSFAKFVYDNKIVDKEDLLVETLAGLKPVMVEEVNNLADLILVDMGHPEFEADKIPALLERPMEASIELGGKSFDFSVLRMGVPHMVIFLEDIKDVDINEVGSQMEVHPNFPEKINVNFVEIVTRNHIKNYTWERGAGRTLGCGTGSCSAVVVGSRLGLLDHSVRVDTEGGSLEVMVTKAGNVLMKGNATCIASGIFYL